MIFLCFSSKDRHSIAESILYHLTNFGLPVWYDRFQMLLGDERNYKNFDEGVDKSSYAIIILSQNSINSQCACEEIELIYERFIKNDIYVFPIFYCLKAGDVPLEFQWMTKLVYKELDASTDSISACNHVICKYLLDRLNSFQIKTLSSLFDFCSSKPAYSYIFKLITSYGEISDGNHDAKITLLYAGILYLESYYSKELHPKYCTKGVSKLFSDTKLHLPINQRELLIFEYIFLLNFNLSIFGNLI